MRAHILVLLLAAILGGCASYASTSGRVVIKDDTAVAGVRIGDRDRTVIRDYYGSEKGRPLKSGSYLPSGLAIRDKLPPALQDEPLPYELERKLSRLPSSYVRVRIGQDIVLMDRNTRVVRDVVYGIGK
jgi:hypothetical protein